MTRLVRRTLVEVDVPALHEAVSLKMFREQRTARSVAGLLGFHPLVFTHLKQAARGQGRHPDYQPTAPVFLSICRWLGDGPERYTRTNASYEGTR